MLRKFFQVLEIPCRKSLVIRCDQQKISTQKRSGNTYVCASMFNTGLFVTLKFKKVIYKLRRLTTFRLQIIQGNLKINAHKILMPLYFGIHFEK